MKFGKRVVTFLSVICILLSALGSAVPVQALDAPVITPTDGSSHMLKRIEITGVDAPKAGEYFDTSAVVISDEDATWEIPVFWIGTHNAKAVTAGEIIRFQSPSQTDRPAKYVFPISKHREWMQRRPKKTGTTYRFLHFSFLIVTAAAEGWNWISI